MKQVVIHSPGRVMVSQVEVPLPGPGEALLKLRYGGICGSDLNTYRGTFAYVEYPRVPGHEMSAEIVEIGDNPAGLRPGALVTVNPYFNCGQCYSCRRSLVNCCENNQTMGAQRDGCFSEYIAVPVERLYPGKGLDAKELALIEPFCIGYHGVARAKVRPGERVLVIGGGAIGVLAAAAAKQAGAHVTLCDVAEGKLALAERMGADTVFTGGGDFSQAVRERTGGDGFDVVIEAVGLPTTFQNCIDAAAFGGRVVLIGVSKQSLDFAFTAIQKKELTVLGSRNARKEDFRQLIDLVDAGTVDLKPLISAIYPVDQAPEAFVELSEKVGTMHKVLVRFS